MIINSKEYWEERFKSNDWIVSGGDNQSKYFYNLMTELIPSDIKDEIFNDSMSICDFGCAEGDGLEIFKKMFSSSDITGVDISNQALKHARKKYTDINFTTKIDKEYDLIISSNTLEHFSEPYQMLENLFKYSKKYIILLLPFKEYTRIDEHLYTFDFDNIKMKHQDFKLLYINWVESDTMYWSGKQIILVYMKNAIEDAINKNYLDILSIKSNVIDMLETQIFEKSILLEKKDKELLELSDWGTNLTEEIKSLNSKLENLNTELKDKNNEVEKKDKELLELSDWGTMLNNRLNKIDNSFLLRNMERFLNKPFYKE